MANSESQCPIEILPQTCGVGFQLVFETKATKKQLSHLFSLNSRTYTRSTQHLDLEEGQVLKDEVR